MKLVLALDDELFDLIKNGKDEIVYRVTHEYWDKKLNDPEKQYKTIALTRGYIDKETRENTLVFEWRGFEIKDVYHQVFGIVKAYVFDLSGRAALAQGGGCGCF